MKGAVVDDAPDPGVVVLSDWNTSEMIGTVRFDPSNLEAPGDGRIPEGVGQSEIDSYDQTKLRISEPHHGKQQFVRESRVVEEWRTVRDQEDKRWAERYISVPSKYAFLLQQYAVDTERDTVTYSEWKRNTSQLVG